MYFILGFRCTCCFAVFINDGDDDCDVNTDGVTSRSADRSARRRTSTVKLWSVIKRGRPAWSDVSTHCRPTGLYVMSTSSTETITRSRQHQRCQLRWSVSPLTLADSGGGGSVVVIVLVVVLLVDYWS